MDRTRSEAAVITILGFIIRVQPMNAGLLGTAWLVIVLLSFDLVWRSTWTSKLPKVSRLVGALVLASILMVIAWVMFRLDIATNTSGIAVARLHS